MDRRGTVALVEEVPRWGEAGGAEVDSPLSYYGTMMCRKAFVIKRHSAALIAIDIYV